MKYLFKGNSSPQISREKSRLEVCLGCAARFACGRAKNIFSHSYEHWVLRLCGELQTFR